MSDSIKYRKEVNDKTNTKLWFFLVLLYLVVDYGRPQDIVSIGFLRPALWVILGLIFMIIKYHGLSASRTAQTKYIWLFILLLAIYIPFARNNYYAYNTTLSMLLYMPFILSVIACVDSIDRLKILMRVYIGLMIYVSLYGYLHGGVGSGSYFSDENDISLYITTVIPFCYFLFLVEKSTIYRFLYATGLIVGVATVVVSFSRGGFIGLVAVFFVIWLVSPRKVVSLIVVLVIFLSLYLSSGDKYKQEMSTVTNTKESTANARLMSWASAWDMFLDRPQGVGGNNFQVYFPDYQGERFKKIMWGRRAHSLWFTLIPELGFLGVLLYLKLLRVNIKDIKSLKTQKLELSDDEKFLNSMSIAFIASLAGFFVPASFLSVLYYPHYWYLTGLIVATVRIKKLI